jgi:alpha-1,2-mannosyltransferase
LAVGRARAFTNDLWALVTAFGNFGLAVWPIVAWLSFSLINPEIRSLNGLHVNTATLIGRDFVNVWHGGRVIRKEGAEAVYDRTAYREGLTRETGALGGYAFSYPPHMLLIALPFGTVSYALALLIWSLGGLALFWWAARPWLRDVGLPGWAVLVLPGGIVNLWAGHFGFLIGALALIGYRASVDRPVRAGAAFALMTIKPHLGLFVPLVLALHKRWQTISATFIAGALLIIGSLLLAGSTGWTMWIADTLAYQFSLASDTSGSEFTMMMPTVQRAVMQLFPGSGVAALFQWATMICVAVMLVWLNSRGAALLDLALAAMVGIFLALPYVFHYDMPVLSLVALITIRRSPWRSATLPKLICSTAFLLPLMQVPLAQSGYWVSPVSIAALFLLLVWHMVDDAKDKGLPIS